MVTAVQISVQIVSEFIGDRIVPCRVEFVKRERGLHGRNEYVFFDEPHERLSGWRLASCSRARIMGAELIHLSEAVPNRQSFLDA